MLCIGVTCLRESFLADLGLCPSDPQMNIVETYYEVHKKDCIVGKIDTGYFSH